MASPHMQPSKLFIFATFFCILETIVFGQYANFEMLELPGDVTGPTSATFEGFPAIGPFTTVEDGRIMKWEGPDIGFVDFAYTSPLRTKQICDGITDLNMGPVCGRPMALSYEPENQLLYIADAYFGLLSVGPSGGLATELVGGISNQLIGGLRFATGLDVSFTSGHIYISDASLTYDLRGSSEPGFAGDSTGRLLKYDPSTREVSVLLSGLSGGGGPCVSVDGTFVLVPELTANRISKYWLKGPKANTVEVLLNTAGNPNIIKRAERIGQFWVGTSIGNIPQMPAINPEGLRFNSDGVVLETVSFSKEYVNVPVSLVQEQDGKLYVGSRFTNFIGVYSK